MLPLDTPSYTPIKPSYDRPSNLKEAIDWIPRVTGKDGGGGDGTSKLAEAVKGLLSSVEGSESGLGKEIEQVKNALQSNGDTLIGKLADGLQQFIGYDGSNGIIKHSNKGIGASNDTRERLGDAVLGFWLGALSHVSGLLNGQTTDKKKVDDVVSNILGAFGKGSEGVNGVADSVSGLSSTVTGHTVDGVKEILTALKEGISDLKTNLSSSDLNTLGGAVEKYSKAVLENVKGNADKAKQHVTSLATKLPEVVKQIKSQTRDKPIHLDQPGIKSQLDAIFNDSSGTFKKIRDALPSLNGNTKAKNIANAVWYASSYFLDVLKMKYTSSYPSNATWTGGNDVQTCAKIFLGCLPLIFNSISYLYWKFSSQGGWKTMTLGSPEPKVFMGLTSIGANRVKSGLTGSDVLSKAFQNFNEFQTAANGSATSYADFLKTFRGNCLTTWQGSSNSTADNHFLSGLYLCSTSYFRHQHQKNAAQARPPSSIREMLYWLIGLTATPQFGDLLGHIHNVVGKDFKVAMSGSPKQNETLSADDVAGHLITTCFTATPILLTIQGTGDSSKPWLHELFATAGFTFAYPTSGPALFSNVSNYAYALQFQLHFLYQQCSNFANTCGWRECQFGKEIEPKESSNVTVSSHICHADCQNHSSGACKHDGPTSSKCGRANGQASPLQAFLTDKLKGFSRSHPSDPSSHLATCSGSMCQVPMGFKAEDLRSEPNANTQGENICLTLRPLCGGFNTPLRQLCEKLGCLTKRTPRTLGDLFGFAWHLNGQLFNSNGSATVDLLLVKFFKTLGLEQSDWSQMSKLGPSTFLGEIQKKVSTINLPSPSKTIEKALTLFSGLPFWYNIFMVKPDDSLPARPFRLKSTDHKSGKPFQYNGTHNDLYSLFNSTCSQPNCGPYLYPLTHSDGATFAPTHASIYLSWVLYLSDDLQSWFQDMLDEFKNIDCSRTGCKECKCESGQHGIPNTCTCPSVVQCGGTLPLLYQHGFRYNNPFVLNDG
ncbi:variant erythrocyte surface antigen-1 family protein [Babesia caballi]|uniref:Variant erythrocyte surface antigen-1 family protein n=1 Tax=Babesia caballi TaxID=5871 RepID=A0AAV4M6D3_BABCB|nr:variant erythrocyte surface antigen-1 family protein [Babesia caballi]